MDLQSSFECYSLETEGKADTLMTIRRYIALTFLIMARAWNSRAQTQLDLVMPVGHTSRVASAQFSSDCKIIVTSAKGH
ncbi:hypothetical protein [Cyclobacterium plantarum]|uniref:Uncharacterized protein n=1 Tax=Cyclobacterium plantarum TaxID=2716263 RepID=A0ABX0HDK9_9BACT|nr:hypothetical protein [Cyclobacterium plantarum]NHE58988.1 hypothetical protein [Cyclobacterium plantarum]